MRTAERGASTRRTTVAAPRSPFRRAAGAAAGPALIVAVVLVAMRGFAFADLLSNQHPDVLSFWLPRSCLLGRSLAKLKAEGITLDHVLDAELLQDVRALPADRL